MLIKKEPSYARVKIALYPCKIFEPERATNGDFKMIMFCTLNN